ncbi:MAG: cbb3-type cytochrome c oxidase subunit I [Labilithrix sp.]|nr:cbb3-type cytochrome c oxidase subunit I [Labilithrix sp.]MCW5815679.1 cbb3-type cytochrome c oxidase subunit I [Labilithrix sp.]
MTAIPSQTFVAEETSIASWVFTLDHKRVGVLYLFTLLALLALGGAFAMAIRLEHLGPGETLMSPMTYNRLFTLHGVTMVWLFLIPSIPSAFGNFLLPIMVGAKDVAFPRLNLASYWVFAAGSVVVLVSMFAGGIDTGWTFYVPYAASSPTAVPLALIGIFVVGVSTIMTGINFIVTVHSLRAPGLGWMKLPLFVWAIYATSVIQVLATPVLGMVLVLVGLDHALAFGLFDPAHGGDPLLYQHLFWFYSHPAVYIMVLPAMGVVSEVIPTFARKNPYSYGAIVYSSLGIAFVGFLTWGHHMFVAGLSRFDAGAFGLLSMLVAVFSAIKVFNWVFTLKRGAIALGTPLLHVFAFLVLFFFGGMTGVAVAATSLDVHWHDTAFVVAHFHFVMVGGTLTAFLAALHYWFPKMTGRLYPERPGAIAAVLVFAGFLLTFVPQFLLGNAGMPRRYATYDPAFQGLQRISTVGSWVLGAGMLLIAAYLAWSLFRGARAGDNPWRSRSFEWRTPSPPPKENFVRPPRFDVGAYDYTRPLEGEDE